MKSRNLCLILGVLMIALLFPYSAVADWQTECVDCPRYFGRVGSRSLELDSSGNPHIAYGGGDGIYYAHYDGVSWHIETVDNRGGKTYPSIAIDSSGKVHISYNLGDLKYATNASGSWVTETVDSEGGSHPSIAIDSLDSVHISYGYYDGLNYGLKYATNASGSWVIQTVDSGRGGGYSIAIDSSDKVHISYYNNYPNYDLKYATNASGSWVTETIDSDGRVGKNNSIAIDSSDKVHISYGYSSGYPDYSYALKYATNASGSWVTQSVDSGFGNHNSIAIDSSDKVHISYYDSRNHGLKYATNASGLWVRGIVDDSAELQINDNTSIAVDSSDNVHISYISYYGSDTFSDLKYALNSSGSWVIETVDSSEVIEPNSSVAIDSSDNVHITYVGPQGLMYMTNASGSWVTEIIARAVHSFYGDFVRYPSIAIDSSDKVHVSYSLVTYDGSWHPDSYLKYATNASGSWVIETVDTGEMTSIAIDSSDNVHIGYTTDAAYSYTTSGILYHLKYATNASGSWVTERVDNYFVLNPSIAIDSTDKVYIAYYYNIWFEGNSSYDDIRYATNASGSWVIETVDDEGRGNAYPSIAVDSIDNVHIAYSYPYGYFFSSLKYATNASGSWVIETADSDGGGASSIAIDSSDNVHISYSSYYDYPIYDLKYATNASGSWVTEIVDSGRVGASSMAMDSSGNAHIGYTVGYPYYDLRYATNKPLPDISVTDSVDPADDLLIPFGEVRGGHSSSRTATVTNTGSADLVIGEVYLTGTDPEQFDIRHDNCSNTAIAPSGNCTIDLVFRPAGTGIFGAELGIDSNDPDTPALYVELTGTGIRNRMKGHK